METVNKFRIKRLSFQNMWNLEQTCWHSLIRKPLRQSTLFSCGVSFGSSWLGHTPLHCFEWYCWGTDLCCWWIGFLPWPSVLMQCRHYSSMGQATERNCNERLLRTAPAISRNCISSFVHELFAYKWSSSFSKTESRITCLVGPAKERIE